MSRLMRFPAAIRRDPEIDAWMDEQSDELGQSRSTEFMRYVKLKPECDVDATAPIEADRRCIQ